jgi:hypothetical protein
MLDTERFARLYALSMELLELRRAQTKMPNGRADELLRKKQLENDLQIRIEAQRLTFMGKKHPTDPREIRRLVVDTLVDFLYSLKPALRHELLKLSQFEYAMRRYYDGLSIVPVNLSKVDRINGESSYPDGTPRALLMPIDHYNMNPDDDSAIFPRYLRYNRGGEPHFMHKVPNYLRPPSLQTVESVDRRRTHMSDRELAEFVLQRARERRAH